MSAGRLAPEVCAVCGLSMVDTMGSSLAGPLPGCLAQVQSLTALRADVGTQPYVLPPWLANMPYLSMLWLVGNMIPPFPACDAIGAAVGGLSELSLSGFDLGGAPVPACIAGLTQLTLLACAPCGLAGAVPAWLGTLSQLTDLHLASNALTGPLPDMFDGLPLLQSVTFERNALSGTLPPSLGRAATGNLSTLCLSFNALTGGLDELLLPGVQLAYVDLEYNQLTGTIPPSIVEARQLSTLILRGNQLTGVLPLTFLQLTELQLLDLGYNAFSSFAPGLCWSNVPSLSFLALDGMVFDMLPCVFDLSNTAPVALQALDLTGVHVLVPPAPPSAPPAPAAASLAAPPRLLMPPPPSPSSSSSGLPLHTSYAPAPPAYRVLSMLEVLQGITPQALSSATSAVAVNVAAINSLADLSLSRMGLVGPWSQVLFDMFPLVQNLYLADNYLSGALPCILVEQAPPPLLTFMNLYNNSFEGEVQKLWLVELSYSLRRLDVRGNPSLVAGNLATLQSLLGLDWTFTNQNASLGIICPRLVSNSGGVLSVDPVYYSYSLCVCATGFYGQVQPDGSGCLPLSSLCPTRQAAAPCVTAVNQLGVLTVAAGWWPYPSPANATSLLDCATVVPVASSDYSCNPSGALTCTPSGPGGMLDCATRTSGPACAAKADGVLCSRCLPGYFVALTSLECQACNGPFTGLLTALTQAVSSIGLATMYERHARALASEEATSVRLAVERAPTTLGRVLVYVRIFWVDFVLVFVTNVATDYSLYRYSDNIPSQLTTVFGIIVFVLSVYFLQMRALHSRFSALGSKPGLFGMVPNRLRNNMNVLISLLKSFSTFVILSSVLIAPYVSFTSAHVGSFFLFFSSATGFSNIYACVYGAHHLSPQANMALGLIATSSMPILPILVIGLLFCLRYARVRSEYRRRLRKAADTVDRAVRESASRRWFAAQVSVLADSFGSFAFLILYMFLYYSVQMLSATLSCTLLPNGSVVTFYPDVVCGSRAHVITIICVLVSVGLQLIGYFGVLARVHWHAFRGRLSDPRVRVTYGIVLAGYKRSAWWFEDVITAKRLMVAVLLSVTSREGDNAQATFNRLFFSLLILISSFAAQCMFRPASGFITNFTETGVAGFMCYAVARVSASRGLFRGFSVEGILQIFVVNYSVSFMFLGLRTLPGVQTHALPWLKRGMERCLPPRLCAWIYFFALIFEYDEGDTLGDAGPGGLGGGGAAGGSSSLLDVGTTLDPAAGPSSASLQKLVRLDAEVARGEKRVIGLRLRCQREEQDLRSTIEVLRAERARVADEHGLVRLASTVSRN